MSFLPDIFLSLKLNPAPLPPQTAKSLWEINVPIISSVLAGAVAISVFVLSKVAQDRRERTALRLEKIERLLCLFREVHYQFFFKSSDINQLKEAHKEKIARLDEVVWEIMALLKLHLRPLYGEGKKFFSAYQKVRRTTVKWITNKGAKEDQLEAYRKLSATKNRMQRYIIRHIEDFTGENDSLWKGMFGRTTQSEPIDLDSFEKLESDASKTEENYPEIILEEPLTKEEVAVSKAP